MSRYSSYGHTRHRGDAPLWPLFAVMGVIILVAFLHNLYQKYRRNKIREYCFKNGLDYCDDPVDSTACSSSFAFVEGCYDIMKKGESSGVRAMMHGMMGEIEFRSADYYYVEYHTTGRGGRSRHTYPYTVIEFHKPHANLGYFYVRDENLFDGIGVAMGNQDIDFSTDKSFSDKFLLQGNEADVRALFNQRVRNAFVSHHLSGCYYEGTNDCMLLYCKGYKTIDGRLQMLEKGYHIMHALAPDNPNAQFLPEMPPLEQEPANNGYNQQYAQGNYGQSYGQQQYGQQTSKPKSWADACDPFKQ